MTKGVFVGFVDKKGVCYSPDSLPSEIQKKIIEVFRGTAYRKQQLHLYKINSRQKLLNKTN